MDAGPTGGRNANAGQIHAEGRETVGPPGVHFDVNHVVGIRTLDSMDYPLRQGTVVRRIAPALPSEAQAHDREKTHKGTT